MSKNKLRLGLSAISDKVYAGRLNKAETMWVGEKQDVTDDFIQTIIQFVPLDTARNLEVIDVNGDFDDGSILIHVDSSKESIEKAIKYLNSQLELL